MEVIHSSNQGNDSGTTNETSDKITEKVVNAMITMPACSPTTPPPPTSRPDFTGKSPVPKGEKSSPASASGRKAPWAGLGRPWPNGLGPFQQYFIYLLFRINSKFNSNLV
jgi:hypothetical protein